MITLRQLRYFDALAKTRHFGHAAEAVGVTQPALSTQIKALEDDLGAALLERGTTFHRLTPLGEEVAARAVRILADIRDLEEAATTRRAPLTGPLRLGVIPSVAPFLLPRLLPVLTARHPLLRLTLEEAVTARLVAALKEGEVDAIVASLPTEDAALTERAVFADRFFLAVPADAPLATAAEVRAADIDAADLLLLADGHCLRDQALAVCEAIDRRRLRGFGATSLTTIVQLVAAGQGITLLPELAADKAVRSDERLKLLPFAVPEPGRTIGIAWRRGSPREADFAALAEAIGAAHGTDGSGVPTAREAPSRNSSG